MAGRKPTALKEVYGKSALRTSGPGNSLLRLFQLSWEPDVVERLQHILGRWKGLGGRSTPSGRHRQMPLCRSTGRGRPHT
jgi:hypothetical protein